MDPTLKEKQNDQTQEKQERQGIISRGISSINSLRETNRLLSNPLGKIGSRVATQTALRGFAAFLASPVGLPILFAFGAILFFTLIIILGFGGAPPSETVIENVSAQQAPSVLPTETTTPAPAL